MFDTSKVAQQMAKVNSAATISVKEAFPIGDSFARVIISVASTATPEAIALGIRQQFSNLVPVAGSFVSLASDKARKVLEGIVAVQQEKIVMTAANADQFKAVASNMFMDKDEVLWSLKTTATGDVLVKSQAQDDLQVMQHLMAVASNDVNDFAMRNIGQANAQVRASIQGGDLLAFVSPQNQRVEVGIACAALQNADGSDTFKISVVRPDGETEIVHRELITGMAVHEVEEDEQDSQNVAVAGTLNLDVIASYYKRMFARRPAYYQAFMQRFKSHAFM